MKKLFAALAVLPLLSISGVAMADQPVPLTNGQMDQVTAGSASGAIITLLATASGTANAATETAALATILQTPVIYPTPFGNVVLSAGAVLATGSSASGN